MARNKIVYKGETLIDLTEDTVTEADVKQGKTFHKKDGTIGEGTAKDAVLEEKTVTPALGSQVVVPDEGADGLSRVTVEPITGDLLHELDEDFAAENIREGVVMFGKTGTLSEGVDTSGDTVIEEVLHKGYTAHDASGKPITGSFVNPYNANTEGDTVAAESLLEGVTAHDSDGQPITGNIPSFVSENPYTMKSADAMVIPISGKYCTEDITVIPALQNKTVTENGTVSADEGYAGLGSVSVAVPETVPKLQEKTVTANGEVTPDEGYDGLSKVTVQTESSGINISGSANGSIPYYEKINATSTIMIPVVSFSTQASGTLS